MQHFMTMWTRGAGRFRYISLTDVTLKDAVEQARRHGAGHPEWGALVEVWQSPAPFVQVPRDREVKP